MKRYRLMAIAVPPEKPTGAIVDHWDFEHREHPDGEWVKWVDIKTSLGYLKAILDSNPSEFINLIQEMTDGIIKCEGKHEEV